MANIQDLFYHGIRQQIRRVLDLLGPERTDNGLSAFEDGASNWSQCFFARALAPESLYSENDVARILGLHSAYRNERGEYKLNLVPVRIVYCTFDQASSWITRDELRRFIESVRDESRPQEVMDLLKSIDYSGVQTAEIPKEAFTCGV